MDKKQAYEIVNTRFTLEDTSKAPYMYLGEGDNFEVNPEFIEYCKKVGYI